MIRILIVLMWFTLTSPVSQRSLDTKAPAHRIVVIIEHCIDDMTTDGIGCAFYSYDHVYVSGSGEATMFVRTPLNGAPDTIFFFKH